MSGVDLSFMMTQFDINPKTAEEAKVQVVLGTRVLANEGLLDALGHLSIRNPENPQTFFQSRNVSAAFCTVDDIIEFNLDGTPHDPSETRRGFGERVIHGAILEKRPDINSVYHGHPIAYMPFVCCPDLELVPTWNYGAMFYNGWALYTDEDVSTAGLTVTYDEALRLADVLGDKYGVLQINHGITVAGGNVAEAVVTTIFGAMNAQVCLDIYKAGGKPVPCTEIMGKMYRKTTFSKNAGPRIWNYYINRAKAAMPDIANL